MLFSGLKPWGEGVHRWLRGELPARARALELEVPVATFENDKPRHGFAGFLRVCHAANGHVSVLKIAAEHLAAHNRYPVSIVMRWLHARIADHYLRPVLSAVYDSHHRHENTQHAALRPAHECSAPDEYKEHTQLAIEAVQQLTICYAIVLNALCRWPDRVYALCHDKVLRTGHRILELIHTEQHLCALRHIKLAEGSWRNCNQLYFALSECEDVQREFPLAGYLLEPRRPAWQPKVQEPEPTQTSVQQIYISLQVTGMMDPGTWPPQQFFWVLVYLRRTLPRLRLRAYNAHALNNASVIITRLDHRSPTFKMRNIPKEPAVLLDMGPLLRRVERDLERLNAGQQDTLFKRLVGVAGVGLLEQAQLLEHMLRKLHYHPSRDERSYVNEYVELRLSWGFSEVFATVKQVSNSDDEWSFDSLPVTQQLTKINTSPAVQQEKPYFLLNESATGMQFKFQETPDTKALFVGQLITCAHAAAQGCSVPQLAYVTRVQRSRSGEIEVAVQKLAVEAECVGVQDPHMLDNHQAFPGLLLHCLDGKWRFLLHSKHGSYAISKLFLHAAGQTRSLKLGRMYLYQPEFVVFDMLGFQHR